MVDVAEGRPQKSHQIPVWCWRMMMRMRLGDMITSTGRGVEAISVHHAVWAGLIASFTFIR